MRSEELAKNKITKANALSTKSRNYYSASAVEQSGSHIPNFLSSIELDSWVLKEEM